VIRGGGWNGVPVDCRSAFRCNGAPTYHGIGVGFRVVLEVE